MAARSGSGDRHEGKDDLSKRLEAEGELRASRDYMRTITGSMAEGAFVLDADGRVTYINRAAERMLGWSSEELVGKVGHDAFHHRRPDGSPYPTEECPLESVRLGGREELEVDEAFIHRDGSVLPVECTAAPLVTAAGSQGAVVVFSDITERKAHQRSVEQEREALEWIGRIRDALDEDRFVLHAQPIIELSSGDVVYHELLIRMLAHNGDLIPPSTFLPTAERYGLIEEIDRWVVEQAVALAAAGHRVTFNVSARSIADPAASNAIEEIIRRTPAGEGVLCAELTETALIEDEEAGHTFIRRLSALGCGIALDDFGTGYGGFTYLKWLPASSMLKIDVQFIRNLVDEPDSQVVVRAVVGLARGFGLRTVAEGVEDERTLEALEERGIDYAQGNAIRHPGPLSDLAGSALSDRRWHEADRTESEADQTVADADQTGSDTDQSASDRDQELAETDERAAERDQALADREEAAHPSDEASRREYEASRQERGKGTLERHATRITRGQVASERDATAQRRDEIARQRDRTAEERDRIAEGLDRDAERLAQGLEGTDLAAEEASALAAAARARREASAHRTRAAADRERAARDREAAARDRQELLAELEHAELDELTGAYRRGFGEVALRNEIERAQRSDRPLVLAFIDVDQLKERNDRHGHAAGDALLRDLVGALRSRLRPYEPVVRWGGDEFVCAISDADAEAARRRIDEALVADAEPLAAISVGLACLRPDDTLETVVSRADERMLDARRRRKDSQLAERPDF